MSAMVPETCARVIKTFVEAGIPLNVFEERFMRKHGGSLSDMTEQNATQILDELNSVLNLTPDNDLMIEIIAQHASFLEEKFGAFDIETFLHN